MSINGKLIAKMLKDKQLEYEAVKEIMPKEILEIAERIEGGDYGGG